MDFTRPNRSPSRRRPPHLPSLLALLVVILVVCLLAAAGLWFGLEVPRLASQRFGLPRPGFSLSERVILSARLLWLRQDVLLPAGEAGEALAFTIASGESVQSIARRLQADGLVRSANAFEMYLIYSGLDTGLKAGEYHLDPTMNALQLAQALQDATLTEVEFFLLPGWRAEEVAAALQASGLAFDPATFMAAVNNPGQIDLPVDLGEPQSLEGLLPPGNYTLKRDLSIAETLGIFVSRFSETVDAQIIIGLERQGLTVYDGIILASIVQREAVVAAEQPMIASVFLNRLNAGIKLDSDPTVQYAVGYNPAQETWWTNPLSAADLAVDSLYNTYLYPGLPPAPIGSPSAGAIRAVAFPAQTPYYYFRARCDQSGQHSFAKTYEEHLQNACP